MTPRKELFLAVRDAIATITGIELVDLQRKQFNQPKEFYGSLYTAALIGIKQIIWGQMVEQRQEGNCTFEVILYTKDGWMDQFANTEDIANGLMEIDLQDSIIEKVLFLHSDNFKPIMLVNEAPEDEDSQMLSYKLTFSTTIYRVIKPRYSTKTITITPAT